MKNPKLLLPLLLAVLSAAALAAAAAMMMRDTPKQALIGGPFQLVAQDGRTVTDKDFAGRPQLVFFGYTHCPDVCPTTLFQISEILRTLGPDAKVSALFVSVDPERDTPASLKDYRVYAKKIPGQNGDYTYDHTAMVYMMDKAGRFAGSLNIDRKPEEAAAQIRPLL